MTDGAAASVTNSGTATDAVLDFVLKQGFSPVVETSKVGKVATVTITDANGSHSFQLRDGNDGAGTGDMSKSVYDTDDDGIVDHAAYADEADALTTATRA